MKKRLRQSVIFSLLSAFSGLLVYLSFPPFDLGFLAWIVLVPLFVSLSITTPPQSFVTALFSGAVFFGLHGWWINSIPGIPFIAFVSIIIYAAFFWGCFGILASFISRRTKWPGILLIPVVWVAIEYARLNL